MAKKKKEKRATTTKRAEEQLTENLRHYIRTEGKHHLADRNVTSIGIGYKIKKGRTTRKICLQFSVRSKPEQDGVSLESLGTKELPKVIEVAGISVPTDVIKRDYRVAYQRVGAEETDVRKQRVDPLRPGVSVSHREGSAGTLGLIVFDRHSGEPCMLSNWHVMHGFERSIGDDVVQPGRHDDNQIERNVAGVLIRSHLGEAGDCAIARIQDRDFTNVIHGLEVQPTRVVRVELNDRVIKSGRTTGVTRGAVRRIEVIARIHYRGIGTRLIGGFEYGPEKGAPTDVEVSMGGDSGSSVLIADADGKPTRMLAGLHFAGETVDNPDEHGIACYAHSVFKKLNVSLEPVPVGVIEAARAGYDADFLTEHVRVPWLTNADYADAFKLDGSHLVPYTHFSVCQSRDKGLARFVAWNIDGSRIKTVSRNGIGFRIDPRVDREFQHGNELYRSNPLDRGHIARRAALCWGSLSEARSANGDSFFYTNIAPQHQAFNRSNLGGLWGDLENAIFADVEVEDLRISGLGGPVFRNDAPRHRGVQIPREFWKLIAYRDTADGVFKVRAFILTQRDLVAGIEALELGEFRMFQVTLDALEEETGLDFSRLSGFDTLPETAGTEAVAGRRRRLVQEVTRAAELSL